MSYDYKVTTGNWRILSIVGPASITIAGNPRRRTLLIGTDDVAAIKIQAKGAGAVTDGLLISNTGHPWITLRYCDLGEVVTREFTVFSTGTVALTVAEGFEGG